MKGSFKLVYLVSYDLNAPEQDYSALFGAIKSYADYCHVLKSQWFISSELSLEDVYNHLIKFVDDDDYLFINEVDIHCRGRLPRETAKWLNAKF